VIDYRPDENPRWTRCRYAIGREPTGIDFSLWCVRCWIEFGELFSFRTTGYQSTRSAMIAAGVADVDGAFDAWQEQGVLDGRWKEMP
jgi:hypothetical protein